MIKSHPNIVNHATTVWLHNFTDGLSYLKPQIPCPGSERWHESKSNGSSSVVSSLVDMPLLRAAIAAARAILLYKLYGSLTPGSQAHYVHPTIYIVSMCKRTLYTHDAMYSIHLSTAHAKTEVTLRMLTTVGNMSSLQRSTAKPTDFDC